MNATPIYIAPEHAAVRDACIERGQLRPEDREAVERIKAMALRDYSELLVESILASYRHILAVRGY